MKEMGGRIYFNNTLGTGVTCHLNLVFQRLNLHQNFDISSCDEIYISFSLYFIILLLFIYFNFAVLGVEPRASFIIGKHFTTELHPWPYFSYFFFYILVYEEKKPNEATSSLSIQVMLKSCCLVSYHDRENPEYSV